MPSALGETVVAPPQAEAPGPVRHDLVHLAQVAAEPPSGAQKAALKTLAHELRRRAPDDGEARARVLVRLLDDSALQTVTDDAGVPLRALAAQALLELGFPHALQLSPEDLEAARRHRRPPLPWRFPVAAVAAFGLVGASLVTGRPMSPLALVATLLVGLGAVGRLLARSRRWSDVWSRVALGLGSLGLWGQGAAAFWLVGSYAWDVVWAPLALGVLGLVAASRQR